MESVESRIIFKHRGRPAEAFFEVSGGELLAKADRHEPAEYNDMSAEFQGARYMDGDFEDIPDHEIEDLDVLELEAMERAPEA